jgi:xylulokinase
MWSPSSDSWLPEALGQLVPKAEVHRWVEHLPEVEPDPAAPADWLDAPVFELVGLAGRPLVACGTAEPMAVALALGLEPGSVGVSLTERTMVLAPIEAPVADPAGVVASRADAAGGHLAIAHSPGGAALVDAMAGLLDLTVPGFAQAASTVVPGEDDVVVVPGIDDRPGAVITGVGAGTGREELARATFEGVAGAALTALDAIAEAGVELYDGEPIHLVAPAAALEVHAQVLATLSGRPVVATSEATAAAGACVQAAAVLGRVHPSEVAAAWDLAAGTEVEPDHDPARHHRLAVNAEERARQRRAWRE